MSSYFDDASLVMIPSGYKTSKVYSVKPTDGTGDLTFTRSNDTATRVNSAGLIEKVRTNLVLQSETFNTTWSASRGSVTANATTAPNGTTTADKFVPDTQVNPHFISQSISGLTNGGIYTSSVYAKAGEWNSIAIFRSDSTIGVSFRLDTQAMTVITGAPISYSITSVGSGWYRCSMSFAIASTSDGPQYRIGNNGNYSIAGNNSDGLFLWGSQYEVSDFGATPYIGPTLGSAVSVGPVANVPRLDYLNSSCPRLLLEPQRTNLRTFSEQFSSLSTTNVTITSNDTTSPDGYANADKLTPSGSGFHTIGNTISVTAGQKYTISVFYKYGTHKNIGFYDNNTAGSEITINMETNAFTLGANVDAGGVIPYGNGWYRAYATFTAGNANMVNYIIFRDNTNNGNYTGDGSYSWFYGWQVEAGAYATSYIPTLGAAVTRGADAASKTGISSLIGQTEGTLFAEFDFNGNYDANGIVALDVLGAGNNEAYIYITGAGQLRLELYVAGALQGLITSSIGAVGRKKIAFAYKANDFVGYMNGVQVGTDTSGTVGAMDTIYVGTYQAPTYATGNMNQTLLFKTRLSNSELAALTTL